MRSDNDNQTMKINRWLGNGASLITTSILLSILFLMMGTYLVNAIFVLFGLLKTMAITKTLEQDYGVLLDFHLLLPNMKGSGIYLGIIAVVYVLILIKILFFAYKMRVAFSEEDINQGQEGTSRWTTQEEIKKQYKKVPLKGKEYKGEGGTIVSRIKKHLYIDDSVSNTLVLGTTRSGKGEMYVFPSIDVYSRARKIEHRPSMIISDPKLELYKSAKRILEQRGYEVRLLNLDDPSKSMGYNPLQSVIDYEKMGEHSKAKMAARSFAFSIFNAEDTNQEPIWKNTATDLFTALIIAITTDCLSLDRSLNKKRYQNFLEKQGEYMDLEEDDKINAKELYEKYKEKGDICLENSIAYIPEDVEFELLTTNEDKVNCFSVINFFIDLCDRESLGLGEEVFAKKAETALDDYFNQRGKLDFAATLYSEIKNAGDKTKGSVYINMQSALSIFNLDDIARMTAKSDIDFKNIGYGEKPIAIFIGIPSEDRSNHFLVTTFISQVYQQLFSLSKKSNGKLKRKVRFILDEFGNFPPIENFAGFVTVCLGIGVAFDIYVQSYNQITSKYKEEAKTIFENFANQIYIKSVGNESAKEFSELLGPSTIITVQRQGGRFDLKKSYSESSKERPLIYPHELGVLKPGECVVYRGIKRTDNLGIAIKSHPIINEYKDEISFFAKATVFCSLLYHRVLKRKKMEHPKEERLATFFEEKKIRMNEKMYFLGTALLYRYQYLKEYFPNPNDVEIDEIITENKKDVDYLQRVYDPMEVLKSIEEKGKVITAVKEVKFKDLGSFEKIHKLLYKAYGDDEHYLDYLGVTLESSSMEMMAAVKQSDLEKGFKRHILALLNLEIEEE